MQPIPMPVRPLDPDELVGAGVLACSILDFQDVVEELKREIAIQRKISEAQLQTLKAFSDLYIELTDETTHRRFLERMNRKIEREAARTRLPLWFWRSEEGLEFKRQLLMRARYLLTEQYQPDGVYLLREFAADWAKQDLSDEALLKCIEFAAQNPGVA